MLLRLFFEGFCIIYLFIYPLLCNCIMYKSNKGTGQRRNMTFLFLHLEICNVGNKERQNKRITFSEKTVTIKTIKWTQCNI